MCFKLFLYMAVFYIVLFGLDATSCPRTITNFHQKNCTDKASTNHTFYYSLDKTTCIPKCLEYPSSVPSSSCANDPTICIPPYTCEKRCGTAPSIRNVTCETNEDCLKVAARSSCLKYCVLPEQQESPCMAYHSNLPAYIDTYWAAQKFKPECDNDGTWLQKQCKGGISGRCFCFSADGSRLFGQALYSESQNMTCACSRKKADLEANGRSYVSLHCDSSGNFEKLQCDIEKGLCWCADPQTGDVTAPFVPEKAKTKLPCYVVTQVGTQYLRQCESKKYAQIQIQDKLKSHGVQYVQSDFLLCDADGSYGAYAVDSGIAYCTWRDNTKIGTWQSNNQADTSTLTCNCARDFKMYDHQLSCVDNGNYVALQYVEQQSTRYYYCIDQDGFAKTELTTDSTLECSTYY